MIVAYFLYFFSGPIKAFLNYYKIYFPVDFTLFASILVFLAILISWKKNGVSLKIKKKYFYPFILLFSFYAWMVITLLITPSEKYAYIKTFYFLTNFVAFLFPLLDRKFNYRGFLQLIFTGLLLVSIYYIALFKILFSEYNKADELLGLYLTLSTLLGIVVITLLTSKNSVFPKKSWDYSVAFISLIVIFLLGARGPIFFVIFVLLMYYAGKLLNFKAVTFRKKFIVHLVVSVFLFSIFASFLFVSFHSNIESMLQRSLKRIEILLNGDKNAKGKNVSVEVRIKQMNFALDKIFDNPEHMLFGYGIGSFNLLYSGKDGRGYPHNIFLETWFELGLVGLILFLLFLSNIFFRRNSNEFINHFVLIYIFLNMMKSNSLVDIRNYFVFFAIFLITENIKNENENLPSDIGS